MIETRLLYYFLAVSKELNITKAAKRLNITQSTLSKQMMLLEEKLSHKLFIRGKRGLKLTEEGQFLKDRAAEVLDLVNGIENVFKNADILTGDISIACGETAVMDTILEIYRRFHEKYPDVKLHLYSGNADSVLERLDKGLADIGLLFGDRRDERYDYFELEERDHFGLLMSSDNPLSHRDSIEIEELLSEPLILSEQLFSENEDILLFGGDYSDLNVVATYNLIYNATFLAEKGIGSVLCLDGLVDTEVRNLVFVPIKPQLCPKLSIVTKRYQTFSPAVRTFLTMIKEESK